MKKEDRQKLRERARELAMEPVKDDKDQMVMEVIRFSMGNEIYAVESAFVRDVAPLKDLTPLPGLPDFILGLINLRGEILSVVNLKYFFNLPGTGLSELNKVIFLQNDQIEFGILADELLGRSSILSSSIQPLLTTVTGIGSEYLAGITQDRIIILNAGRMLSDPRMLIEQN